MKLKAEDFYGELINLFSKNDVPFLIGGTYAVDAYLGIQRPTKDLDIFCCADDYPSLLKLASEEGFKTEILDEYWIAKIHYKKFVIDVIFAERNGLEKVNDSWFKRAGDAELFHHRIKLVPVEDIIRSKAYIQNKERFDGCDVAHLILKFGDEIDWKLLREKIEPNWEVLFAHLINFTFAYPNEIEKIPKWLIEDYMKRLHKKFLKPVNKDDRITRGLLISWHYKVAIERWGYRPVNPFFPKAHEQRDN